MSIKFSLVIPTYNEAKNIEGLINSILKTLSPLKIDFEIIVVDDNSPDGTWKIVESISQRVNPVKIIRRPNVTDLGSAVVAGWKAAQGEILGVIDGDFQHTPETLAPMLGKITSCEDADIVVASRNVKGGGILRRSPWRRFVSHCGTALSYIFIPQLVKFVKDPMSGYFILRRQVIENAGLNPLGYKVFLEVLAKGKYRKVYEIPYFFQERKRGGSKAGARQCLLCFFHILRLSVASGEIYGVITIAASLILLLLACVGITEYFK